MGFSRNASGEREKVHWPNTRKGDFSIKTLKKRQRAEKTKILCLRFHQFLVLERISALSREKEQAEFVAGQRNGRSKLG